MREETAEELEKLKKEFRVVQHQIAGDIQRAVPTALRDKAERNSGLDITDRVFQ